MTYVDVCHIYGMVRAGYVPQFFSLRLPSPDVVYELLHKAGAGALVFDKSYEPIVTNCPVPTHVALEVQPQSAAGLPLPPVSPAVDADEVMMVFHTSGSTSGSPKLVPCNRTWLDAMIAKAYHTTKPNDATRQDVTTWL